MTCIKGIDDLTCSTIARVKVVRADGETLQSDAKEFGLDARFHVGQVFGQDFIQGFGQQLTVAFALHGEVFQAVVHPDVHDARVALCLAHGVGDVATAFGMLDPEGADGGVGVSQTQISALGMTERGAVEVELHVHRFAPVDPALKVLHAHLVAVDELAAEVAVDFMKVDALCASEQRVDELKVGAHLVDGAGTTGVVTRGLDAAREAGVALEAHHIVGLPAVQRDGGFLEGGDGFVSVDAEGGVAFLGEGVGVEDVLCVHRLVVLRAGTHVACYGSIDSWCKSRDSRRLLTDVSPLRGWVVCLCFKVLCYHLTHGPTVFDKTGRLGLHHEVAESGGFGWTSHYGYPDGICSPLVEQVVG